MKIVLSFDDGRSDAYEAYKILKQHNLVASFHITTGFIDGSFKTNQFGIDREPLTIEQLKEMSQNNMGISSHGDKHIMDYKDFSTSITKLNNWGKNTEKYGFSVPNSDYKKESLSNFINDNKTKLSYVRVGRNPKCYTLISKINYAIYHLFKFQFAYNYFNKFNLINDINKWELYSLVIKSDTKTKSLIKFINKYKNTNNTLIIMLHSIVDKSRNKWEWSISNFVKLCKYLKEEQDKNNIKVLTLEELTKDL